MNFLDTIPELYFEVIGIVAGLSVSVLLVIQIFKEYKSDKPSSLSSTFVIGWLFIYSFWGLYGLRFHAIAVWLTNAIALVMQIVLITIVFRNRKKFTRNISQ